MSLFEISSQLIAALPETSFAEAGVRERADLQRLLREKIEIISPDTLVIAEEFADWDESRRRIDLLGLDKGANLVVIELKRTDDGGHLELQAIRYAAMVSTMTFEQVVLAHQRFLDQTKDAKQIILDFLEWEYPDEQKFAQDVKIVLVSAEFSKEVTTAVLWLNERQLDIRCVRLKPYKLDDRLLIDVQQVIPIPEASEYQVRVHAKELVERASRNPVKDLETIWKEFEQKCSPAIVELAHTLYEWLDDLGVELFTTTNSFAPKLPDKEKNQYLFKVKTDGHLVIWFQYLASKPPFSAQPLRAEFLSKLNQIPGVEIPADRVAGKPRLPMEALLPPEGLRKFQDVIQWAIAEIRTPTEATQT